ncbi:pyridoxal phosphate-dependent enzyme, beta subunit [Atractiella rhizophila]|nr:pyridoxal phosphate-dependent enzyme, beta subunit [Atractiella rhizophila]
MDPIHSSVLELIGETPMIRLERLAEEEGLKCNLLAKVEFFNAGGSVKDRIAKRMVEEAEKDGVLVPGKSVIIEPTSGNTGIGLALQAAVKGYRCIICMPEKMSQEKANTLLALGAEIVRTPTEAAWDSPESHLEVAKRLRDKIPHALILDQYGNPNNPLAHYLGTGAEIVSAVTTSAFSPSSKKVDVVILGAGTGGTLTGVSKAVREHNPQAYVIGVDPVGSILAQPSSLNDLKEGESSFYQVEGIGYDFVPDALKYENVDLWMKSSDVPSFTMARRLISTEGLLVGGSSGTAMYSALAWLKSEDGWKRAGSVEGMNVVVVLPDGLRNYVTKPWLTEGGEERDRRQKELLELAKA